MRILGIDPGTRYFGYGVIERLGPGRVRYIECGVLEPPRQAELAERLSVIADGLREVIGELAPTVVAVEGVFHGVNARSALQLGHSRGVALAAAGGHGLRVHEYPPATVKRAVAGNGAATKHQVQTMVRMLCGLARAPALDASDALAVAICHAFRLQLAAAVGATAATAKAPAATTKAPAATAKAPAATATAKATAATTKATAATTTKARAVAARLARASGK